MSKASSYSVSYVSRKDLNTFTDRQVEDTNTREPINIERYAVNAPALATNKAPKTPVRKINATAFVALRLTGARVNAVRPVRVVSTASMVPIPLSHMSDMGTGLPWEVQVWIIRKDLVSPEEHSGQLVLMTESTKSIAKAKGGLELMIPMSLLFEK